MQHIRPVEPEQNICFAPSASFQSPLMAPISSWEKIQDWLDFSVMAP